MTHKSLSCPTHPASAAGQEGTINYQVVPVALQTQKAHFVFSKKEKIVEGGEGPRGMGGGDVAREKRLPLLGF